MISEIKISDWISARFFMKSPMLDGTRGNISSICKNLADFKVGELPLIAPGQIHGTNIIIADDDNAPEYAVPNQPRADGIFLTSLKAEASLRFADCAPLLIFPSDEWVSKNFSWALLLHSGFKGTVQNIVKAGIEVTEKVAGINAVQEAYAWIGPCIAKNSYTRMIDQWTEQGLKSFHPENFQEVNGLFYFDIKSEIKSQLKELGVSEQRIFISDINTAASHSCYSYRNGDTRDRMFLHVRLMR